MPTHITQMVEVITSHRFTPIGTCACGQMVGVRDPEAIALHLAEALRDAGLAQDPSETVAAFLGAARGSLDAEGIDRAVAQRVMNRLVYGNPEGKDLVRLPCGSCAVSCQGVCK